jgi:hypothetical protein
MDIFINQLKRIVQTPIKPSSAKVKAPVKEPAANTLTEDFDHLEHHEKYIDNDSDKESNSNHSEDKSSDNVNKDEIPEKDKDKTIIKKDDDEPPHLDIYV